MKINVLSIAKVGLIDYQLDVEVTAGWLFPRTYRQQYRGRYGWHLYPQGTELSAISPLDDLLDQYVQQFEWSQEHGQ